MRPARGPQEPPKSPQEAPKRPPEAPGRPPKSPREAPEGPKILKKHKFLWDFSIKAQNAELSRKT